MSQNENSSEASARPGRVGSTAGLLVFLVTAAAGAVVAWQLIGHFENHFQIPADLAAEYDSASGPEGGAPGGVVEEELTNRWTTANNVAAAQNTALSVGLLGLAVAGLIGLGAGVSRKSVIWSVVGLLFGAVLGGIAGVGGGYLAALTELKLLENSVDEMYRAMAAQGIAFCSVGIAAGFVGGLPSRRLSVIGGTLGSGIAAGIIAGLLFTPIAAVLFSSESAVAVPAGAVSRLVWAGFAAGLLGICIGRSSGRAEGKLRAASSAT